MEISEMVEYENRHAAVRVFIKSFKKQFYNGQSILDQDESEWLKGSNRISKEQHDLWDMRDNYQEERLNDRDD